MSTIIGDPLPNIPWQPKPSTSTDVVWRHSENPVIARNPMPGVQGIYNSAVVPYRGEFIGVFRTESKNRVPFLHLGRSPDGIAWEIEKDKIRFECQAPGADDPSAYAYDPRVCRIDDAYYVTWCSGHNGPTIAAARTEDFVTFHRLENAFLPFNRNGVLFPRQIRDSYVMLSRPSDNGHTPFGDIYLSQSPDMCHWGRHRLVMKAGGQWWQNTKIGAGPIPIETTEGWLLLYHGVINTCNGFVYSMGAAIVDLDEPWRVLFRTDQHILTPETDYEVSGHVPNVVFPCAALADAPSGRLAIYYGAADTCTCLAYADVDALAEFTKANSDVF